MAGTAAILNRFRELYPASHEPRVWRAPGRVNLVGEHTDYNLGLVLPMAIGLECRVAAAPSHDDSLRAFSEQFPQRIEIRLRDCGAGLEPAADMMSAQSNAGCKRSRGLEACPTLPRRGDWSDRVAGIAWELSRRGIAIEPQNILISSTIPIGGGLSSSAALGVSLALALGGPREPIELARIAHAAETNFVGVPCGIMDQFASALGGALLLDCRSLEWRTVRIPEGLAIVTANSMVKHELGISAYRTRVEECAAAARALGVASLRDARLEDLARLDGVLLKRARHVITENARVEAFQAAAGRGDLEEMGRLAVESHQSLRDDYEVSCPELDFLVENALGIPGVLGARMTGGGFGGSTVNLVRQQAVANFISTLSERYRAHWDRAPDLYICRPSSGASQIL